LDRLVNTDPWILLTNDDGIDSPVLAPLIPALSSIAPVRTVVPASECSWTGKVISRFNPVALDSVDRWGQQIWTLDGYPADCANIGVHALFDTPPALVVSGINMGTNAGLAFFLSSGTVGAAVEGFLAGVPSLALSLELPKEAYALWRRERRLEAPTEQLLHNAVEVARSITDEVWRSGLPSNASLMTVNMPTTTSADSPRRFAGITPTIYGSTFRRSAEGDGFEHAFTGLQIKQETGDIVALQNQEIALTPVRFALDAEPTQEDRLRFERLS
jgi:5'-nucleotidase